MPTGDNDTADARMIKVRVLNDGSCVQLLPDGSTRPIEDRTDYTRLAAMTEAEIEANALSDPDNPPFTDEELAALRPMRDREQTP